MLSRAVRGFGSGGVGRVTARAALLACLAAQALPPFARAGERDFKIALSDVPGGPQHAFVEVFRRELGTISEGRLTATLFPDGQLGSERRTVRDTAIGMIDMTAVASSNLAPASPSVGVFGLPYLVRDLDDMRTLLEGDFARHLRERILEEAGLRVVGWTYSGFRVLTNSVRDVATPGDLRELRVRVPNALEAATVSAWGGTPVRLPWIRVREALTDGIVDGQAAPLLTVDVFDLGGLQDRATELRHVFMVDPLLVAEPIFQSLSGAERKFVLAAGYRATRASRAFLLEREAATRDALTAAGMSFTAPADDGREFVRLAREKVWPRFVPDIGAETVSLALGELGRHDEAALVAGAGPSPAE